MPIVITSILEIRRQTLVLLLISAADGNIARKHAKKLTKYSDLWAEVSRMWPCRTLVVPMVLGALGTVHAGIAQWLDIIPSHHNLQYLQKQCFLDSFGSSCLDDRDV